MSVIATIGLVLSLFAAAPVMAQPEEATHGKIAIFKLMCDEIGQQDTCNGRDTSLSGYNIDFDVFAGTATSGTTVADLTVTLSENAEGQGNTGAGSQGRVESADLLVGTYTVCEVPTAYLGESLATATATVQLDPEPRPVAGGGGSSGGSLQTQTGDRCITVVLTGGTAELKFLNLVLQPTPAELGSITIIKDAQPDAAQDFTFTATGTGLVGFSLDDDGDAALSNQRAFPDLAAGAYTVTEVLPVAGWALNAINCTGGGTSTNVATGTVTINLAAGADVTCTFVNVQQQVQAPLLGSITIVKDAQPNAPQDFAFTTTGTGLVAFTLDDDADAALSSQRVFTGLSAATYTVTEAMVGGWRLSNLACTAGGTVNLGQRTATITLAAGANVTCTFTNVPTGGQLPSGGAPSQPVRQGTLSNTAMSVEPSTESSPGLIFVGLMLLALGALTATPRARRFAERTR